MKRATQVQGYRTVWRYLLGVVAVAAPVLLVAGAWATLRALESQRDVYLRSQAAQVAGTLETAQSEEELGQIAEWLVEETAGLRNLEMATGEGEDRGIVSLLVEGRELFHFEKVERDGKQYYRYYTPFHMQGVNRVARIEMDPGAADFLVGPGRRNLAVSAVAAVVLLALYGAIIWTERRVARLEQLAEIGRMSAVLAHEIRNPLGTIKGFAQLAKEQAVGSGREMLDPVLEEVDRLERLVQDLLLYGRPFTVRRQGVKWEDLARSVAAGYGTEVSWEERDLQLATDPDLLKQALLNLVQNALEAGAEQVTVRVREAGGRIRIVVEDDGPGLDAEARRRLFEPFYTTKPFGTGLGLSITRKVAEALGGHLTLKDRAPRGTEAVLELPNHGTHSDR